MVVPLVNVKRGLFVACEIVRDDPGGIRVVVCVGVVSVVIVLLA